MSRSKCGRCTLPIGGMDERIRCDGCCETEYHLSCTKLNVYDLHRCTDNDNLLWMCDRCLYTFRKQLPVPKCDDTNKPNDEKQNESKIECDMESTLHSLQLEVAEIKQCLSDLKPSTSSSPTSSISSNVLPVSSTPQGTSGFDRTTSLCQNETSQLLMGTRIQTAPVNNARKFWIFFTKVAKHVSVDAFKEMVSNCLHLNDPPDVHRIIPRWSSYDTLRYVSFKVGVDWSSKDMALKESTWPDGLFFREFIRGESSYWEP